MVSHLSIQPGLSKLLELVPLYFYDNEFSFLCHLFIIYSKSIYASSENTPRYRFTSVRKPVQVALHISSGRLSKLSALRRRSDELSSRTRREFGKREHFGLWQEAFATRCADNKQSLQKSPRILLHFVANCFGDVSCCEISRKRTLRLARLATLQRRAFDAKMVPRNSLRNKHPSLRLTWEQVNSFLQ